MKYSARCFFFILFSCSFSLPTFAQQDVQKSALSESVFERKSISFFFNQATPLNEKLVNDLKESFPRANYITSYTDLGKPLETVIQELRNQPEDALSSELKAFLRSDYILVPQWSYDEIKLTGPYPPRAPQPKPGEIGIQTSLDWNLNAFSKIKLNLGMYDPKITTQGYVSRFVLSRAFNKKEAMKVSWFTVQKAINTLNITRSFSLGGIDSTRLLTEAQRVALFNEVIKYPDVDTELQHIKAQDPGVYFAEEVPEVSFGELVGEQLVKKDRFKILAHIGDPVKKDDYVRILIPENETTQSLGVKPDAGYAIFEKKLINGVPTRQEVAYLKVRERQQNLLLAEPIFFNRPLKAGDEVVEISESLLGVGFRLGGAYSFFPSSYGGNLGADLRLNLGKLSSLSELYVLGSFDFLGSSLSNGSGSTFETGIEKRWYAAPLSFSTGLRAGFYRPWFTPRGQNRNAFAGIGGTAYAGVNWHQTSQASYGLQAGWKQYFYDADGSVSALTGGPFLEGVFLFL